MDVDSLAWRTDLALLTYAGSKIEDHGDHLVVRTPANPGYYWGNFLLLEAVPEDGHLDSWLRRFEEEFPEAGHRTFGVDGTTGSADDLAAFREAGFDIERSTVMTATEVHPPARPHTGATLRPLASDDDWEQQVALAMVDEDDTSLDFATRRALAQRALVDQGRGQWFGAFLDQRLVSSLGLFVASEGLARFQEVKTHPDARGRGLCGTLVHHASRYGFDELGVGTLVMVADPDYLAIRVYRAVGFTGSETQLQATRTPD